MSNRHLFKQYRCLSMRYTIQYTLNLNKNIYFTYLKKSHLNNETRGFFAKDKSHRDF